MLYIIIGFIIAGQSITLGRRYNSKSFSTNKRWLTLFFIYLSNLALSPIWFLTVTITLSIITNFILACKVTTGCILAWLIHERITCGLLKPKDDGFIGYITGILLSRWEKQTPFCKEGRKTDIDLAYKIIKMLADQSLLDEMKIPVTYKQLRFASILEATSR